ncbi:MAG: hypothetical protein JSS30_05165 [Verrucomicrobia bacterium]|nr:hypothetical protein [Verrucomicrobiota bacterium]
MATQVTNLSPIFFEAKWPTKHNPALKSLAHKVTRFVWDLISVIIFPIGLIRIGLKWLKNKILRVIVPGNIDKDLHLVHFKTTWDWVKAICLFLANSNHFKIDRDADGKELLNRFNGHPLTLKTPDNVVLDGAFFPGKIQDKAIIYAPGNSGQWENLTSRLQELLSLNTSLVVINPRGVGKNKGHRSEEGYALDTYAAFDFLINERKIDPNKIVQVGFSMGGGYGACGAALTQEQYPDKKINAVNINSYADLQKEVEEVLKGRGLLKLIGRLAAQIFRLNLNPKAAWDKLKGEKVILYNPDDDVIPKVVSLYKAVKLDPVGTTKALKLHRGGTDSEHNRPFDPEESTALQIVLRDILKLPHRLQHPPSIKIKTLQA